MSSNLKTLITELVLPGLKELPNVAVTPQAVAMLTTIGLQESNLVHRYRMTAPSDPMRKGTARGLWQFTKSMTNRVLTNATTQERAQALCRNAVGSLSTDAVWANLEFNDDLACQFARLLLLPDPAALPMPTAANAIVAWNYYIRVWNSTNNASRRDSFIKSWNNVIGNVKDIKVVNTVSTTAKTTTTTSTTTSKVNVAVSTSAGRKGLSVLHPQVRRKAEELMELCRKNGLPMLITDTLRTKAEQDKLFNQTPKVTNAQGYQSPHTWAAAFDFCRNVKGREFDNSDNFFNKVGALGKQVGLFWGGDFRSFKDMPHFEDSDFIVNNSTRTLMETYGTFAKFKATWA